MTKEELRRIYLQKRRSLSDVEYEELNIQICENFFNQVDLASIKVLHVFIPMEKNREPDTIFIIERIQKKFMHVSLVIPKVNHVTEEMENFLFEGINQLEKNKWNILEPKAGKIVETKEIDMVLIPLLVFDEEGNRVGYGKGFYDKLLSNCRSDCKRIGLSLLEPVAKINDINPHDKKLHACITPSKTWNFEL